MSIFFLNVTCILTNYIFLNIIIVGDFMLQKIIGKTKRAIEDFDMIQDGDKIAVGLSGGKDSIALLYALHYLQNFIEIILN